MYRTIQVRLRNCFWFRFINFKSKIETLPEKASCLLIYGIYRPIYIAFPTIWQKIFSGNVDPSWIIYKLLKITKILLFMKDVVHFVFLKWHDVVLISWYCSWCEDKFNDLNTMTFRWAWAEKSWVHWFIGCSYTFIVTFVLSTYCNSKNYCFLQQIYLH